MRVVELAAHTAAGLVLVAGVGKLARPGATLRALRLRLPAAVLAVRLLGVGEITLGAVVLLVGGRAPLAVLATVYAGFAVVALRQHRAGRSCGCFGAANEPVGPLHVGFDLAAGGIALAAATGGATALPGLLPRAPLPLSLALLLVVVAVVLGRLVLTDLAELTAVGARLRGGGRS